MMYEFRVSEMAEEFGVHRNTIRNWIAAGTLPAKEGPGRKYLMKFDDYQSLCQKFGREPHIRPDSYIDLATVKTMEARAEQQIAPMELDGHHSEIAIDPSWADACLTCGTCASACPIAGVDGLDSPEGRPHGGPRHGPGTG